MAPSIMWFRRDLRLGDHPALHEAVRRSAGDGVVPVFVVDDQFLAPSGPTRVRFLVECLRALGDSMGTPVVLRRGDPASVIPALAREIGATAVIVTGDAAPRGLARDAAVAEALKGHGMAFTAVSTPYAVDPGTVTGAESHPVKVFSAFRRRWETFGPHLVLPIPEVRWLPAPSDIGLEEIEGRCGIRRPTIFGDLPDGPPAALPVAGEAAATIILDEFIGQRGSIYKIQRDILADAGTSGLSPYLRFGCIHPRTALAAASGPGEGFETFRSELCWREFYADVLFNNPTSVSEVLQRKMANLEVDTGAEAENRFRVWARGETGVPLVDASMRQLMAEGWMHNRGRMITASFLVKHLHLDWRWGARWFMWRLVDGDIASNQHGWQWTAGTGTDAAPFHRIFSPIAQAERFDPEGTFIHRFIPELAGIPAPAVLQPGGGVDLLHPSTYPPAMVDLKVERLEALRRFADARERFGGTTS